MKKQILIFSMLAVTAAGMFTTGCKKSSFDERYNNPEQTTNGTIDGLFTGMFRNRRVIPNYRNIFTFQAGLLARVSQTVGYSNTSGVYNLPTNYTAERWNDFYTSPGEKWTGTMAQYKEMEKLFAGLSETEKEGYELLMACGRVMLYDQATQMVDLWGSIPFSSASALNSTGVLTRGKYDDQKAVYDSAIANLQRVSDYLTDGNFIEFYKNKLSVQDLMLHGDIDGWRRYTNSLLLRLAMRISFSDAEKAQAIATKLLNDPTRYPLVRSYEQNIEIAAASDMQSTDLQEGLAAQYGGSYMIDTMMLPSGDPRLRVYFQQTATGTYKGVANTMNDSEFGDAVTNRTISGLDSVTYIRNTWFPGIVITAAETNFNIAEAYARWGVGDAGAYEAGIRASIAYWFVINGRSTYGTHEAAPTETEITAMLGSSKVALGADLEANLNKIATQKWLDFGVMLANQAWTEIRRTGYPKLNYPTDNATPAASTPPVRLAYPADERNLNAVNYAEVADQDNIYKKLFWDVKD